jgi:predicted metalloendopeptidase
MMHLAARRQLASERIARLHTYGPNALFGVGIGANTIHPDLNNTLMVEQSGLGLEYAFYTGSDPMSYKFREQYKKHVANLMKLWDSTRADFHVSYRSISCVSN